MYMFFLQQEKMSLKLVAENKKIVFHQRFAEKCHKADHLSVSVSIYIINSDNFVVIH